MRGEIRCYTTAITRGIATFRIARTILSYYGGMKTRWTLSVCTPPRTGIRDPSSSGIRDTVVHPLPGRRRDRCGPSACICVCVCVHFTRSRIWRKHMYNTWWSRSSPSIVSARRASCDEWYARPQNGHYSPAEHNIRSRDYCVRIWRKSETSNRQMKTERTSF